MNQCQLSNLLKSSTSHLNFGFEFAKKKTEKKLDWNSNEIETALTHSLPTIWICCNSLIRASIIKSNKEPLIKIQLRNT